MLFKRLMVALSGLGIRVLETDGFQRIDVGLLGFGHQGFKEDDDF